MLSMRRVRLLVLAAAACAPAFLAIIFLFDRTVTAEAKSIAAPSPAPQTEKRRTSNGRSVKVRINDRGPFAANRIIDVSKAAADKLDMLADCVANVRLSLVEEALGADMIARPAIDIKSIRLAA
jgi:hypothetical protein